MKNTRNTKIAKAALSGTLAKTSDVVLQMMGLPVETELLIGATTGIVMNQLSTSLGHLSSALQKRRESRAQLALCSAFSHAQFLFENGKHPPPASLESGSISNSESAELFEAVVEAARNSVQEERAHHYGLFWTNYTWSDDVDFPQALRLLDVASQLSVRQWKLIQLIGVSDGEIPLPDPEDIEKSTLEIAYSEANDLYERGLTTWVQAKPDEKDCLWRTGLSAVGANLRKLLALGEIQDADAEALRVVLMSLRDKQPAPSLGI